MKTNAQKTLGIFVAAFLLAMLPGVAQAQCGAVLTTNTTLTGNLFCPGNGPELGANNITLDCDGFTITGSGSGTGVLLNNISYSSVTNCVVENFSVGLMIDGGSDNRLNQNVALFNQSTTGGFHIRNGSIRNFLTKNASILNVGRGFSVQNSDRNILVDNEAYDNDFRGFDIISSSFNYLQDNFAVNNLSAGIVVQNYGGTATGNVLENNFIDKSGSEGLAMFASGNTVMNLISNNNGTWGIREITGGTNTYSGNSCTGNGSGSSLPGGLC